MDGDGLVSRTVFLTGATGFIGSRLARRYAERGDRVKCLVRASSNTTVLHEIGAELVEGELGDADRLAREMHGADLACHLAAAYDMGPVDARAMQETNVDGTRAFIEAVGKSGIARAVYVSTTAALPPATDGESKAIDAFDGPYPTVYHRTKAEAHRLARAAQARGQPLVIACPAVVYGPGDVSPNGRFLIDVVKHRVPGLLMDPAWYSYVHVDDVVEGLVLAGDRGHTGSVYVLSGENATLNDFAKRACEIAGVRAPVLRFPTGLARVTAGLLDAISRVTNIRFPLARETIDASTGYRWLHSHEPATREWGWQPRPLSAGLPETIAWVKSKR